MNKIVCIIPARYDSTRFPGKVLALISGKPMIQHVWEKAKTSRLIDRTIIATDDKRVLEVVKKFTKEVVMTSKNCNSGTERVAEAIQSNKINCNFVVNLQADEPLISSKTIEKTIQALIDDKVAVVSTPIYKLTNNTALLTNPNVVKVVFDKNFHALYFSRSVIPYYKMQNAKCKMQNFYKHIGLYVYQKDFLKKLAKMPQSKLEQLEQLEQLRILENGYKIKVVPVSEDTIPVDVPQDLNVVAKFIDHNKDCMINQGTTK